MAVSISIYNYLSVFYPMLSLPNGDILGRNSYSTNIIFRSTDAGYHWTGFDTLSTSSTYFCLVRSQDGSLFLGTGKGLFKKPNNMSWRLCNSGFPNPASQVTAITGKPGGFLFAGTTRLGSFVSANSGQSWVWNTPGYASYVRSPPFTSISRFSVHPNGSIFAASRFSHPPLAISNDDGNHWQDLLWLPSHASDVAIDANGIIYFCYEGNGVHRSSDGGQTWTTIACGGESLPLMHITNQGILVVLTTYAIPPSQTIHYITRTSTNGGATWALATLGDDVVLTTEYASTTNGYLFGATTGGMYRSTNLGQSWDSINSGLTSAYVHSLATNSREVLFAGTHSRGVFKSTDYGDHWESFNAGLTDTTITSLYCDAEGYLYAGGWNQGIFKTISTTSVNETEGMSTYHMLEQNFPNPFNPATTITYILTQRSHVVVSVYDIMGRVVAVLVDRLQEAGRHQTTFAANQLVSGIYFCRLNGGGFFQTKKMVLMK